MTPSLRLWDLLRYFFLFKMSSLLLNCITECRLGSGHPVTHVSYQTGVLCQLCSVKWSALVHVLHVLRNFIHQHPMSRNTIGGTCTIGKSTWTLTLNLRKFKRIVKYPPVSAVSSISISQSQTVWGQQLHVFLLSNKLVIKIIMNSYLNAKFLKMS